MVLDTVRFVVGTDGRPTAILVDIETWRKVVEALEDAEDVSLAREALAEFEAASWHLKPLSGWGEKYIERVPVL